MQKDMPESMEAEGGVKQIVDYVSETARPVYLTNGGRPKAVMLDIDSYNALLDAAEGADAAMVPDTGVTFLKRLMERYRSMGHHA